MAWELQLTVVFRVDLVPDGSTAGIGCCWCVSGIHGLAAGLVPAASWWCRAQGGVLLGSDRAGVASSGLLAALPAVAEGIRGQFCVLVTLVERVCAREVVSREGALFFHSGVFSVGWLRHGCAALQQQSCEPGQHLVAVNSRDFIAACCCTRPSRQAYYTAMCCN